MAEKLALSLQQDLLTLLCHSDEHGKTVSKLIPAELFEGDYRTVADKALQFWEAHGQAPKQHVADLLSNILEDPHDRRAQTYRRILIQMYEVKDQINFEFVLGQAGLFVWAQRAKQTVLSVAEKLDARGASARDEVEALLGDFLRDRTTSFDPGIRLTEVDKILDYFASVQAEFRTGIKELDEAGIVPTRGKLWLLIGAAKSGKTWALVQLGKMAFLQRKKVLHISLEVEAEEAAQRYYQALFGASKRGDFYKVSTFKTDKNGHLDQIVDQTVEVPFTFNSDAIKEELLARLEHSPGRASNIVIKRFAMRSLTIQMLEAFLESLEAVHHFVPDMVLLDYPGIMKTDANNHRITLGRLVEEFRGMGQRRNFAACAVHQGNRGSAGSELVKATDAAEDWTVACTADFVLTLSKTAAEERRNLARLFVDLVRGEASKFGILIAQSYATGQFCLESTRLDDSYARIMEAMAAEHRGDGDDD